MDKVETSSAWPGAGGICRFLAQGEDARAYSYHRAHFPLPTVFVQKYPQVRRKLRVKFLRQRHLPQMLPSTLTCRLSEITLKVINTSDIYYIQEKCTFKFDIIISGTTDLFGPLLRVCQC